MKIIKKVDLSTEARRRLKTGTSIFNTLPNKKPPFAFLTKSFGGRRWSRRGWLRLPLVNPVLQMQPCLCRPYGPGVLKRKNPAQTKVWRDFSVSSRSMAALDCGVGGVRTLVQTSNSEAFYTFSFRLFFDVQPAENHQLYTYPRLSFETASRPCSLYIYFVGASYVSAVNQGPHETSWLPTL